MKIFQSYDKCPKCGYPIYDGYCNQCWWNEEEEEIDMVDDGLFHAEEEDDQ
jgi:hypothetical protein